MPFPLSRPFRIVNHERSYVQANSAAVLDALVQEIGGLPEYYLYGRVTGILGMMVEVGGLGAALSVGGRCDIQTRDGRSVTCEAVGFRNGRALVLPFGALDGIGLGSKAELIAGEPGVRPARLWLGI